MNDTGENLLRGGAAGRAIAAGHLPVDHGGPQRLLGAPIGGVYGWIEEESKDSRQFDRQMPGEALQCGRAHRRIHQIRELVEESPARNRGPVGGHVTGVAPVADRERLLQDRVDMLGPRGAWVIGGEFTTAP